MGYIGNSPAKNEAVDTAQLASPLSGDLTVAGTLGTTGDTAAGDDAAVGYTAAEGLILTGQGSTDDVTIKNDADATVLQVATGTTNVELTAGNLIIGTHGKGIDFSANTDDAGEMTAEILDDYEEGTWTPVLSDGTRDMAMQGAYDTGYYTKVGNLVHVSGFFATTSLDGGSGNATGAIRITGLPFTIANNTAAYSGGGAGWGADYDITAGHYVSYYSAVNDTNIRLQLWDDAGGRTDMQASEWSADGRIIMGFSYRAA